MMLNRLLKLGSRLYLPQKFMQAQDLSWENTSANENAGHEPQEASQVFRSDLSQVHGHHAERDTWKMEMKKAYQSSLMTCFAIPLYAFLSWSIPECIPVTKRPKMTISGDLQILLNPMRDAAKNTSTVELTTVPFLQKRTLWSPALALLIKLGQSCSISGHLGV